MSDWKVQPTIFSDWPADIDYVLAIDENGTPNLKEIGSSSNDLLSWFTITGVLFSWDGFPQIIDEVVQLKEKFWENGIFNDSRVVFHSRDIRKKTGPFNPKLIDYSIFLKE